LVLGWSVRLGASWGGRFFFGETPRPRDFAGIAVVIQEFRLDLIQRTNAVTFNAALGTNEERSTYSGSFVPSALRSEQ
jgi:hypothetical protein